VRGIRAFGWSYQGRNAARIGYDFANADRAAPRSADGRGIRLPRLRSGLVVGALCTGKSAKGGAQTIGQVVYRSVAGTRGQGQARCPRLRGGGNVRRGFWRTPSPAVRPLRPCHSRGQYHAGVTQVRVRLETLNPFARALDTNAQPPGEVAHPSACCRSP